MGENLKNTKTNEKTTETQRIISEMYIKMLNIRKKAEQIRKEEIKHKMQMTKYMNSLQKMERIINESNTGQLNYL